MKRILVLLVLLGVVLLFFGSISSGALGVDALSGATRRHKAERMKSTDDAGGYVMVLNQETLGEGAARLLDVMNGETKSLEGQSYRCTIPAQDKKTQAEAERIAALVREAGGTFTVTSEDTLLAVSKAEYGAFEVLLLPQQEGEDYTVSTLYEKEGTEVLWIGGAS
jgi:hypothetical protein